MKQSISLPLESFAVVKSLRPRWQDRSATPRWVDQIRAMRIQTEEAYRARLCAELVVAYNAQFGNSELWDISFEPDGANVYKEQRDKVFYLAHKRCVDERGNFHNDNDAAFVSGDVKLYYLHGVQFEDPLWITTPVEQIDSGRILEMTNVDQRSQMIRRKGLEQFLSQLFHRVLDKRGNYELLQVILGNSTREFGTYLKMLNPSVGVWHMEGVPNDIRTVEAALLWRNNGWFVDADQIT